MSRLKENYDKACNAYLSAFCSSMDLSNEGWVADYAGGAAIVGDFCVEMHDLITAVENKVNFDTFAKWYDYCLTIEGGPNLRKWISGCPRKTDEELAKIEALRKHIFDLEDELEKMLKV